METDQGPVAALGAAVGAVLYAGAEVIRRIRNKAPQDDPVIIQIQKNHAALVKAVNTVTAQLDYLLHDHHTMEERMQEVERKNGNGKK